MVFFWVGFLMPTLVLSYLPYCRKGWRKVFARRMYRRINDRSHVRSGSSCCGDFNASRGIQRWFASYYKVQIINFFTTARHFKEAYRSLEPSSDMSGVDPNPDPHESTLIIWLSWVRISILGMRIRIREHGKWPKLTTKPGFLHVKNAFAPLYLLCLVYFFDLITTCSIFFVLKFNFLRL